MEETGEEMTEQNSGSKSDSAGFDGFHHLRREVRRESQPEFKPKFAREKEATYSSDDMRRSLIDVGPDQVEQVLKGFLVSVRRDSQSDVLDDRTGRLTMNSVPLGKSVLEESGDGVDVVLGHLSDVLEDERESFEATVSDVEFGSSVLVEDSGDGGERSTGLGNDGWREDKGKKNESAR